MPLCNWKNCNVKAVAVRGKVPSKNLCFKHAAQWDKDTTSVDPKKILSTWIKANGGAKKVALSM